MVITPAVGSFFLNRATSGGVGTSAKGLGVKPPYWVRVESRPIPDQGLYRLTGWISGNGHDWQVVGRPVKIAGTGIKVQDFSVGKLQVGLVVSPTANPRSPSKPY
jgi:hypothetical protein